MFRNLMDHPINLLIVVLVIVVVVGWKRLPDVARSLGRSVRILKSEVDEMKQDGKSTPSAASSDTVKGDTVKDETGHPAEDPIKDPTRTPATDPTQREKHNQTPA